MRALAAAAGLVLVVGIIGVIITFLMYILLFLAGCAAVGLLLFGGVMFHEKWLAKKYTAAEAAKPMPVEEFEQSVRHPAWQAAIDRRRHQRQRLIDQYVDLDSRITRLKAYGSGIMWPSEVERVEQLDREMVGVRDLMRQTFGRVPSRLQALQLDVEPSRDEVIHLDREFMRNGDCRYGHWGEHMIDDAGNGRVLRRCMFCEPNSRWTERS